MAEPLYHQTAGVLRARIAEGVWKEGDRLPPEWQLCEEFGVSTITMRRAVATLVAEGLVARLQGKGTFVTSDHAIVQGPPQLTSFTEDLRQRGWEPSARVLSVDTQRAENWVSTKLGLPTTAPVTRLRRLRMADGLPVALQTAYLSALQFPGLERFDFSHESLYEVLSRRYGVKPGTATDIYRAGKVDQDEARILEVAADSAAFRVERLTTDSTGKRIELVESVIRGDRYTVVLRLSATRQASAAAATTRG
jgi:DNA-binding GntR family transcriptional regulator